MADELLTALPPFNCFQVLFCFDKLFVSLFWERLTRRKCSCSACRKRAWKRKKHRKCEIKNEKCEIKNNFHLPQSCTCVQVQEIVIEQFQFILVDFFSTALYSLNFLNVKLRYLKCYTDRNVLWRKNLSSRVLFLTH